MRDRPRQSQLDLLEKLWWREWEKEKVCAYFLHLSRFAQAPRTVQKQLSRLTPKEEMVLMLYYGVGKAPPLTFEKIGLILGVTRNRPHQLHHRGLRRLNNPAKYDLIAQFIKTTPPWNQKGTPWDKEE